MKIRRKRPSLFPNLDTDKLAPVIPIQPYQVKLGANFRVGNPANAEYLFLWNSLKQKMSYLHKPDLPSGHMVDEIVTITGILKRKDHTYTAILERKDKHEFYQGLRRIYADIANAVVARELISL